MGQEGSQLPGWQSGRAALDATMIMAPLLQSAQLVIEPRVLVMMHNLD